METKPLRIFTKDIVDGHPMRLSSYTDSYYAALANEINRLMCAEKDNDIDPKELKRVAVNIALYMEDVVSETGLWKSFTGKVKQLYGKPLPFYDVDEDGYYDDEPNLADVQYVMWKSFMEIKTQSIINPKNDNLLQMAGDVFELLDAKFEEMPVNEKLKAFFTEASFVSDFIEQRAVLQWVFDSCYLIKGKSAMDKKIELFEDMDRIFHLTERQAFYATNCISCFEYKVGALALYPKEWLGLFLKANGNGAAAVRVESQEYRPIQMYLLKDTDGDLYTFSSVKDEEISLRKAEMDAPNNLTVGENYLTACVVKYGDKWELNGFGAWNSGREKFDNYAKSVKTYDEAGVGHYDELMAISGGSPLFYFKDAAECADFLAEHKVIREADKERTVKGVDGDEVVLFMPREDSVFYALPGLVKYIKDERNPYYDQEYAKEHAVSVLHAPSGELVRYLMDHDMVPDAALASTKGYEAGRELLQGNFDFLARTCLGDLY